MVLDANHPVERHPTTAMISAVTSPAIEDSSARWLSSADRMAAAADEPR